MAVKLKEETILNQWSMLIDGAAARGNEVLDAIQSRLKAARIPGNCEWSVEEVESGGMFSKTKREFLIVRLDQFSDYRNYVGVRPYGAHLDCCRFLTVEPGFLKRQLSQAITGGEDRLLSSPKNLLVEQDLTAWVTVVHHCVLDGVKAMLAKLGQDPAGIRRETRGFLQVW
ncbi:MAG TPA: hypothetical protein VMK12_04920 [Anaeromyxobacteraceae bacterium]|nr:hypothetical protein [Anaeromyxobacteraceae bacterium]